MVTLNASWDVWDHKHTPIELYGEEGTIHVPDPNFFGGEVAMTRAAKPVKAMPKWDHPLGVPNQKHGENMLANYRTIGLADMVAGIAEGRPHRCSMEMALHAIDVMTGILQSGESRSFVDMQTTCERPAALTPKDARALMARKVVGGIGTVPPPCGEGGQPKAGRVG